MASKPDLQAIYRLEFYKKKKNWKLSHESKPKVENPVHILNETYNIEESAWEEQSPLNVAFVQTNAGKETEQDMQEVPSELDSQPPSAAEPRQLEDMWGDAGQGMETEGWCPHMAAWVASSLEEPAQWEAPPPAPSPPEALCSAGGWGCLRYLDTSYHECASACSGSSTDSAGFARAVAVRPHSSDTEHCADVSPPMTPGPLGVICGDSPLAQVLPFPPGSPPREGRGRGRLHPSLIRIGMGRPYRV